MKTYQNPFRLENQWNGNQLGDPFIMRYDGQYYLYCSSHEMEIKCWTSDDLVNWSYSGSVCDLPEIDGAYAPEVIYTHGKFYMVCSPKGSGHYLLVSDSPTGAFSLISENFGLLIDGSLFADDDGTVYFLRAGHKGIEIHDVDLPSTPITAGKIIPETYMNHWTEGPMIIKRDGLYYLTFTGNHLLSRGYRIDYAVSETSPAEGYVNPRKPTILIEVGDEFHALGHSSTVLAPDMDSYYIAYHSFNFLAEPKFRSLNIDRLFFDTESKQMYVNACWWSQKAPTMPIFTSRGGEGLCKKEMDGKTYLATPPVEGQYTAELNINPKGKEISIYIEHSTMWYIIQCGTEYVSFGGEQKHLQTNIDMQTNITFRIAMGKRYLRLWLNGMLTFEIPIDKSEGETCIGLWSEAEELPGFIGVSNVAEGAGDYTESHNVPGRFLAIHGNDRSYRLNVKKAGQYVMFHDTRQAGVIGLDEGETVLRLDKDVKVDEIELIPYSIMPESLTIIEDGCLVCENVNILGHKGQNSMLRKEWGYTCAENYGMGFVGDDSWTDYEMNAQMNINFSTFGSVSIFFHATKESWFPHQASPSFFGYCVRVNRSGIKLLRCQYGEEELASVTFDKTFNSERICMSVNIWKNEISLGSELQTIMLTEIDGFPYGKVGFEATGEGWGFESLKILTQ